MPIRVERMIGPNPVSSSRTTTFATNAVEANMKKIVMVSRISPIARGEFLWTLPPEPIEITSTAVAAKTSRKKIRPTIQKIGWRSW